MATRESLLVPISKSKHPLPSPLNPVGNVCYPLYIPDDDNYRNLLLGAIRTLTEDDYYREASYNLTDVQTVTDIWRNRTLVPFVQAMNDNEGCSGGSGLVAAQKTAQRTTDINFSQNLDVPIMWNAGDFDSTNNSRIYADSTGLGIVTASAHIATLSTANLQYCFIRRNGTDTLSRSHVQAGVANGEYSVSWSGPIASGDYFELCVRASSNSKVSVLNSDAHLGVTVIG